MVRNLARGMAVLCFVLPLASCVFFFSAFSPLLTQVVARTDLSGVIPADSAGDYGIFCVTATAAPGGEFVLLMNRNATMDPRVIVLDANLKLIQAYTSPQLGGWASGAFSGSSILAEADGNIEIGNLGFSADELRTVGLNPSWINQPVLGPSFSSLLRQSNDVNFQVTTGNLLTFTQYRPWWALDYPGSVAIAPTALSQFNVVAVFNVDDALTPGTVILALEEQNNSTIDFLAIPRDDFTLNAVLSPLFGNYPHASYSQVDSSSVGFAGDCIVAYSYQDHALVRYSLTPPFDVISKLPVGQTLHRLTYGYKADGSYMVQLDQDTRELTKVAKWW